MDFATLLTSILELLKKLFPSWFTALKTGTLPWMSLIKAALQLLPVPASDDKEGWRVWILRAIGIMEELSAESDTKLDDDGCKILKVNVESPVVYDLLWARIQAALVDGVLLSSSEDDDALCAAADEVGIDPAMIFVFIQIAVQIIGWWRSRKEA